MGLFSDFVFGSGKSKRITKEEFEKVRIKAYSELERDEWPEVEQLFNGDLNEDGIYQGIDREEFKRGIA